MLSNPGLGQNILRTARSVSFRQTRTSAPSIPFRSLRQHARSYATPSTPSASTSTSSRKIKFGPMTVILCCVPLLTGYLGVWQIQRLNWKLGLIEDVDRNLSKDPLILPDDIDTSKLATEYAFRRVLLHGHFAQPVMLVGPRVYEGQGGYHVFQPFVRSSAPAVASEPAPEADKKKSGRSFWSAFTSDSDVEAENQQASTSTLSAEGPSTILVNRGFVTTARAQQFRQDPSLVPSFSPTSIPSPHLSSSPALHNTPSPAPGDNEIIIQALLRPSEIAPGAKPAFTPDNNKANNEWFYVDAEAMRDWAQEKGGGKEKVQAVMVDEIYDGDTPASMLIKQGVPVGRPATVELRNQHAMYAATWFSLSAMTSVMVVRLLFKGRGGGAGGKRVAARMSG